MREQNKQQEELVIRDSSNSLVEETRYSSVRYFPKHVHSRACFTLLLKGNYAESFGTKLNKHNPMTVWWRRPNIERSGKIERGGAHFFNVEIKKTYLDLIQSEFSIPNDFETQNTKLTELMFRLYSECKDWNTGSSLVVDGLTLEILGTTIKEEKLGESLQPKWLTRIVERLNDEFLEPPSVVQLAIEESVHPVYLARIFRKFYQQSIGEYVRNLRVKYSAELMLNSDLSLADIASHAGFSDQSHFTRIHKRITGITPGTFRKALKFN